MGTFWEGLEEQNKDKLNGVSCFEQCDQCLIYMGIYC